MAESEGHVAPIHCLVDSSLEGRDHRRPGSPGEVESRHGIARTLSLIAAPLSPADDREESNALLAQPRAFLTGGEMDIGFSPPSRPGIDLAIESRGAHPIRHRLVERIANAEAALLRRIHKEQPTERPERLAPQVGSRLLLEKDHAPARVSQLGCCHQPCQAGTDDDYIRV